MENMNTVEEMLTQAQDDAAMGTQEPGTLAEVVGADDSSAAESHPSGQPSTPVENPKEEPGWFKRRMEKHDQQMNADFQRQLQEMREGYEAQLAPLREASYRQEAEKLVADGEFKSVDRALEYVRLKAGAPAVQTKQEGAKEPPARDEQGRFAKTDNSEVAQYAQRLVDQAAAIHDATGVDVMALYNSDPDVKRKINSREWTFADVYKAAAKGSAESSRPAAPSPVRSSNGIALGDMNIAGMSAAQFDKLDDYLAKGGKINMT